MTFVGALGHENGATVATVASTSEQPATDAFAGFIVMGKTEKRAASSATPLIRM